MSGLDWNREGLIWPHREASQFITIGGAKWHVQRMGSGPTLLLLHGTGASVHSWRGLMPMLARTHEVIAPDLPRKLAKPPKPTRHGFAYVTRRADGAWLLETREPKGLLGGMLGWPGSDWAEAPTPAPPLAADWRALVPVVRHTFTHFHLELTVMLAQVPPETPAPRGSFVPLDQFSPAALPTVMRKCFDLALPHIG